MATWSMDYEEFAELCEQLLDGPAGTPHQVAPSVPPGRAAHRGFRGRWFVYAAACEPVPVQRFGLRRGFGFPRCRR